MKPTRPLNAKRIGGTRIGYRPTASGDANCASGSPKTKIGWRHQAATVKTSKYKKLVNTVYEKLRVAKKALKDLSKSYHGHLRKHELVEVELQRLRSDLADQ